MNLYYLSQGVNNGYDTYSSCVVAAKNEEEAKKIHPSSSNPNDDTWYIEYTRGDWAYKLEDVKCELIGKAVKGTEKGVICASFNAG